MSARDYFQTDTDLLDFEQIEVDFDPNYVVIEHTARQARVQFAGDFARRAPVGMVAQLLKVLP